jgi:solute carrier family 25 S-adenosylmethionine transporter 26
MTEIKDSITYLYASGLARAISVSIMFPFDTIKSRLQNNSITNASLYTGYRYTICTQTIYGMLVFGTYENIKHHMLHKYSAIPHLHIYLASAIFSDMLGSVFLSPCEIIKQNIQIGKYKTVSEAIQHIKWQGLYKGYGALIARDLPFRAIQLPLYDILKEQYDNTLIVGCVAGMTAAAITNPIDVIKTQIMCNNRQNMTVKNMFAGLPYRVAYLGGMSSLYFILYEKIRLFVSK